MIKIIHVIRIISAGIILSIFTVAEANECNLHESFKDWKNVISTFPNTSTLKDTVNYNDYLYTAKSLLEEDGHRNGELFEDYIRVSATNLLYKSAWLDSRIYEVIQYKEICRNLDNQGELVLKYKDINNESKFKVIPFSLADRAWRRSFSMTSGYSYMLEKDAEEILSDL